MVEVVKKEKKKKKIKPPSTPIQSIQYDLFSQFVSNDLSGISNTIEAWESIPKYFLSPKHVEKLRFASGHADPFKWEYFYNGYPCIVKIQPALIEQEDGSYKAFFPGITEEIIEEVLKKILTRQQYGIHDPEKSETWVRFSLRLLYKELKERKKTRDIKEIKQAIDVMNKCNISFFRDDKEIWSGAILQDLVTVGRDKYLSDRDSHHIARLPLFISHSINQLEYRQFNYARLMQCSEQLSRWIYKRLINRFVQASYCTDYHFMYSDIKQFSGFLQQNREVDNRRKMISALDELKKQKIILSYESSNQTKGRKIIDVKYLVFPTPEFISEQKAANKQKTNQLTKASLNNLPVDNFR